MPLAGHKPMQPSEIRANQGPIFVNMGPSGSGKTTLLETLHPKYEPVVILDIDMKTHVLKDNPQREIYACHSWKELDEYVDALIKQSLKPQYKTLVIDGLALMQTKLAWGKHNVDKIDNPQLRQSAFGKANVDMVEIGQRVRILAERGMHVIYNIWAVDELQPDTGMVKILPDLTPTLLNRFLGALDFVVLTQPNSNPKPYPPLLRTGGSEKFGTRTAISPESPLHDMPPVIFEPSWTSIFDSYHGEPWPKEKHSKK